MADTKLKRVLYKGKPAKVANWVEPQLLKTGSTLYEFVTKAKPNREVIDIETSPGRYVRCFVVGPSLEFEWEDS